MNFSFDYSGKRVLVTGGVSGIGRAVALGFSAAGAEVVACGLTEQELVAARADPAFARISVVPLDVTDKAAVDELVGGLGSLDVVVTSAGIIRRDSEHEPEVFDQVIDVNLSGSMRVATAARPLLARARGSIVLVGSVMSFFGGPRQPAYSASKGAIRNLTMSLASAYAEDGIRVNAVAPGWVITDLSKGARENAKRNAMILARTPMARWAQPDEIADPVLFLCSDAARFMTGTVMLVDGGFTSVG
ncbi:MAG TPA: SDR family oxidoreductase [Lautropia sp.]|jgi:NAD(P)-dependent dehydrogenase (short-subunit alcohol dehydrogenase family)|nr:SDR family oxidoreductase [Lautropia sp.]